MWTSFLASLPTRRKILCRLWRYKKGIDTMTYAFIKNLLDHIFDIYQFDSVSINLWGILFQVYVKAVAYTFSCNAFIYLKIYIQVLFTFNIKFKRFEIANIKPVYQALWTISIYLSKHRSNIGFSFCYLFFHIFFSF